MKLTTPLKLTGVIFISTQSLRIIVVINAYLLWLCLYIELYILPLKENMVW